MTQEDMYFRPPSEVDSFLVRVMRGCSYNACAFCNMFKAVPLQVLPLEAVLEGIEADAREIGTKFLPLLTSLYLEGGDPMALPTRHLLCIMEHARRHFPALNRIVFYATARSILTKTEEDLAQLGKAGLRRVFMGLESGCDEILIKIRKGCTRTDLIRASNKLDLAGIENDVSMMLGIGGPELSERHAVETAEFLNVITPVCVRIRTFIPTEGTPMGEEYRHGRFILMEPHEILRELRLMLLRVTGPMQLLSEHWSDFISLDLHFPQDKGRAIEIIDAALLLPREKFRPTGMANVIA